MHRSAAIGRLHESIQHWIEAEGWTQLRPFQTEAIDSILDTSNDVLIMAPTASGKTEAALLPLISACVEHPEPGVRLIYIIPLKALANDLDRRLEELCRRVDMQVHRWHGDVSHTRKRKLLDRPNGLLLVTPESLEAIFMNHPYRLDDLFGGAAGVIIDEVHSYLGTERGAQLQSLLSRLEAVIGRSPRRIGLSATVGDVGQTIRFMRRLDTRVDVIHGAEHRTVDVRIRTFDPEGDAFPSDVAQAILTATDQNGAVFCNSRAAVEFWTARLSDRSNGRVVDAHHGSLSKSHREGVEAGLRTGERPATVVATSTLELGIDIGSLDHVAQIEPPPSVASLHQRAGRAGRRGLTSRTDILLISAIPDADATVEQSLHADVARAVASVELQREGWCETSPGSALHLSTLVQQVVSVLTQLGGCSDDDVFALVKGGNAFAAVTREVFDRLIKELLVTDVLMRPAGEECFLRIGDEGERLTGNFRFFAAFSTPVEYRVVSPDGCIGTLAPSRTLKPGTSLLFAGRRWSIQAVSRSARVVEVSMGAGGRPPLFPGSAIPVATEVVRRMFELYTRDDEHSFVDALTRRRLHEARVQFRALQLRERRLLATRSGAVVFPWIGTRALAALQLCLQSAGLRSELGQLTLDVRCESEAELILALDSIVSCPPAAQDLIALLDEVADFEKHHNYLSRELVALDYLSQRLDVETALEAAKEICELHRIDQAGEWSDLAVGTDVASPSSASAVSLPR